MTTDDVYYERGINLRHGYLTEYYVEDADYIVPLPGSLREVGVLLRAYDHCTEGNQSSVRDPATAQSLAATPRGGGRCGHDGLLAALALRLRGLEVTCLFPAPGALSQ